MTENNFYTLQDYYQLLKNHDWHYEFSDDHNVWRAGAARRQLLRDISEQSPEHLALYKDFCQCTLAPRFALPPHPPLGVRLYLACPYTTLEGQQSGLESVRTDRAAQLAGRLMAEGYTVFAPVVQGHVINQHLGAVATSPYVAIDFGHNFWMGHCLEMLKACHTLVIATFDGWKDSRGVKQELAAAVAASMPIVFVNDFSVPKFLTPDEIELPADFKAILDGATNE